MKKVIILLAAFILFVVLYPLNVSSNTGNEEIDPGIRVEGMEEDDGTLWWRFAYWDTTTEFPDYIGYIETIEETGQFEVGLVDNTVENQQAILEMVPNSQDNITFQDAEFSREEQKEFSKELNQTYMHINKSDFDIRAIGWDKDAIALYTETENVEEYQAYFETNYPNRVVVHPEEEFVQNRVDWVGHYLSLLPPEPEYGTEAYVIHHNGEDDGTIDWRYQYWSITENYPENIAFVRINTDQITWEIGLVENTLEARQEILNHVPNSAEKIDFLDAAYSMNELNRIQEEITEEYFMSGDHPLYSSGVRSDKIVVIVDPEHLEEYAELFNERYGDMVQVEPGAPFETTEDSLLYENTSYESDTFWISGVVLLGMAAVIALFIWQRIEPVNKKQTNTGHVMDDTESLSNSEVKELIKQTEYEPDEKVYRALLEKIKKE